MALAVSLVHGALPLPWQRTPLDWPRDVSGCHPGLSIWEETGNSIARHLWDAGVAISCHFGQLLDEKSPLAQALFPSGLRAGLRVLELGTGCGVVGIALAHILQDATVLVTDLPEVTEIIQRNVSCAKPAAGSSIRFEKLDWDSVLPSSLTTDAMTFDLVLAADCTYNPDSSPALVDTISRLVQRSSSAVVAVAMKFRHPSEAVFFDLMTAASFLQVAKISYPLPGDSTVGDDTVYLHVYQHRGKSPRTCVV